MQAHELINEQTQSSINSAIASFDSDTPKIFGDGNSTGCNADHSDANGIIEEYLDTLFVPLLMPIFTEQCDQLRTEARRCLQDMVQVNEEAGMAPKASASAATRQFRQSNAIVQELSRIRSLDTELALRKSTSVATTSYSIAVAALATTLIASGALMNGPDGQRQVFPLLFILAPGLAGLGVGLVAPARPVRASLAAILKTSIPALGCYILWSYVLHYFFPWDAVGPLSIIHAVSWTAVGSLSAGIGSGIRKLNQRLRGKGTLMSRNESMEPFTEPANRPLNP